MRGSGGWEFPGPLGDQLAERAPRAIGSRPYGGSVRTGRGCDFAFCPPPFWRACRPSSLPEEG
ncbi:hypothetical protein ABZ626_37305, partial [Streptomyces longispororuber]|uniref:hypothetical protein n=1 Tax=Streptomyces longispororuber TaxID=68230 RepID=UPI0033D82006